MAFIVSWVWPPGGGLDFMVVTAGSAADLGGVGASVSGGGTLPFDGDSDVDAEGAGEGRGGQLGGELEQRGRAGLREADAEFAESFAHGPDTDRSAGLAAGEEPG
ncbi:hypothetical protein AB0N06_31750 [Streptomyces sp. NPDC051020]|uniref:hypothetical protein n=1 Tax=Streptomyces sp. NPDC051020 TaxID=3155409 RepID=UPI00344A1D42